MPTTTPTILLKLFIGQPFRPSPVPRTAWPTTASRPGQDVGRVGGDPLRPRLKSSRWLHAKADALDSLESEISETGTMVTGSAGQPVLHPAVAEARQARLAISRLLGSLSLPDQDAEPRTVAGLRAQRAARSRWGHEVLSSGA
jgi:hypothetical protein